MYVYFEIINHRHRQAVSRYLLLSNTQKHSHCNRGGWREGVLEGVLLIGSLVVAVPQWR